MADVKEVLKRAKEKAQFIAQFPETFEGCEDAADCYRPAAEEAKKVLHGSELELMTWYAIFLEEEHRSAVQSIRMASSTG